MYRQIDRWIVRYMLPCECPITPFFILFSVINGTLTRLPSRPLVASELQNVLSARVLMVGSNPACEVVCTVMMLRWSVRVLKWAIISLRAADFCLITCRLQDGSGEAEKEPPEVSRSLSWWFKKEHHIPTISACIHTL